jgi:hypothetical protein
MPIERATPAFTEHPVYEKPPDDASLWRYMDVARFVALLERRALFFSSIRAFPDRFEGSLTPDLVAQFEGSQVLEEWRHWPLITYVNCWNEEPHENVALWSMYTSPSGGVAIRSSPSRIRTAIEPDDSGPEPADELYMGRVRYVDYSAASIPSDNTNWPVVHKRLAYRFEHEVRLALWPQRLLRAAQHAAAGGNVLAAAAEIAPVGYDVAVDPTALIESVVLAPSAPDWLLDLVKAVASRYSLAAPVVRSDLDAEPT